MRRGWVDAEVDENPVNDGLFGRSCGQFLSLALRGSELSGEEQKFV
jgi:hypothetical protein